MPDTLHKLKLHELHVSQGGKMVPFAGYEMPVQYADGVMSEHLHTRAAAGLFDVSHMGQILLRPKVSMENLALALEALMPMDVLSLAPGRQRYGLFTNDAGGILDDLMFANRGDHFLVIVNAACKAADLAHLQKHLSNASEIVQVTDRALIALQGPLAETALARLVAQVAQMRFMDSAIFGDYWISRSGYTGEDGFEISLPDASVDAFVGDLLRMPEVKPIGLGARDSLRLEAGLCLYGHDIDATTSPIEAGLNWAIQKCRRTGGARVGGFPGAVRILDELSNGSKCLRVGLRPEGRAPMREGVPLFSGGVAAGNITSGGFGPSIGAPIAMGYVAIEHAKIDTTIEADLRGKMLPARIVSLPFQPTNFKR